MDQHDQMIEDLCKRLSMLRRTLRLLLLEKATTGFRTPVDVLIEIDDKRVDILELKAELRRLGKEVDDQFDDIAKKAELRRLEVDADNQFDDTAKVVVVCASDEPPQPSAAGDSSCGVLACPQPALRLRAPTSCLAAFQACSGSALASSRRNHSSNGVPLASADHLSSPRITNPHFCSTLSEPMLCLAT